ncbi:LbetaH domain-containing protein [Nocardia bovistercoris]|uniref:PglD N-terminal domain-containing protein n=1 Tax=Nocardia bovistercoris TaxID=2785916 RepID=A0A931IGC5_9NOCA|nr:hypothetical protein [Nocardia bovistercoris]MBH0779260.1 hypothetical protein [Nocardia bovistercoris]
MLIGAGKFALEVARYVEDMNADRSEFRIAGYLSVAAEADVVDAELVLAEHQVPSSAAVVVAVADIGARREIIDGYVRPSGRTAANIVHPSTRIDPAALSGDGNVLGPWCYVGVDTLIGSFNVVNYQCSIGHHSRLGSNNFLAPNFNCGNSVGIGDDNFFGLSCTVAPEVSVGDRSVFQAGICLFEDPPSDHSYFLPNRLKSMKSLKEMT